MSSNRFKLVDAVDLNLAPYDAYLSEDTNINILKCPPAQFYNNALKKCE